MKKIIEVVPYDPNWPHIYEKEVALIRQALGGNCLAIHHVGSTAVPGLAEDLSKDAWMKKLYPKRIERMLELGKL